MKLFSLKNIKEKIFLILSILYYSYNIHCCSMCNEEAGKCADNDKGIEEIIKFIKADDVTITKDLKKIFSESILNVYKKVPNNDYVEDEEIPISFNMKAAVGHIGKVYEIVDKGDVLEFVSITIPDNGLKEEGKSYIIFKSGDPTNKKIKVSFIKKITKHYQIDKTFKVQQIVN